MSNHCLSAGNWRKSNMRAITAFFLCLALCASCVSTDSDPAPEDQEAAAQAAAERGFQQQEAEAERRMDQAGAKQNVALTQDKRRWLGSAAAGKSDGDVERLYDEMVNADTDAAESVVGNEQRAMRDRRANEQMKAATGKSIQEIVDMSPEEQQEWAAEMQGTDGC
jgi:hypothetical protein